VFDKLGTLAEPVDEGGLLDEGLVGPSLRAIEIEPLALDVAAPGFPALLFECILLFILLLPRGNEGGKPSMRLTKTLERRPATSFDYLLQMETGVFGNFKPHT
jgi:hypothetical protein